MAGQSRRYQSPLRPRNNVSQSNRSQQTVCPGSGTSLYRETCVRDRQDSLRCKARGAVGLGGVARRCLDVGGHAVRGLQKTFGATATVITEPAREALAGVLDKGILQWREARRRRARQSLCKEVVKIRVSGRVRGYGVYRCLYIHSSGPVGSTGVNRREGGKGEMA